MFTSSCGSKWMKVRKDVSKSKMDVNIFKVFNRHSGTLKMHIISPCMDGYVKKKQCLHHSQVSRKVKLSQPICQGVAFFGGFPQSAMYIPVLRMKDG